MKKLELEVKDSALAFLCAFLFCMISSFVMIAILSFPFKSVEKIQDFMSTTAGGTLLSALFMDIGLVATFLVFNRNKDNKIVEKVSAKKCLIYFVIAIVAFFMLAPIVNVVDYLLNKINIKSSGIGYELTTKNYFISIISLVVLPAIFEELVFRGLIFKGLKSRGKAFSVVMTSVMFAIFHMSLNQLVYPILFGMLLNVIMFYENNIIYTIIAHLTNNLLTLTLAYFKISIFSTHWTFILLAIVLVACFVAGMVWLLKKNNSQTKLKIISSLDKKYLFGVLSIMIVFYIATLTI